MVELWFGIAALTVAAYVVLDGFDLGAGALHQLRVHVPDRPGVLAGIFQALGAARINVSDFELEHLSPERGGTLTVLVAGEDAAEQAARLLESQSYGVVVAPVIDA